MQSMFKTLFAAVAVLMAFCGTAAAQTAGDEVGIHTVSWHSNPDACTGFAAGKQCQNWNPGVYFRRNTLAGSPDWVAGTYYNSVQRQTVYAAAVLPLVTLGNRVRLEIAGGLATGYQYAIVPIVMPSARVQFDKRDAMTVGWIPRAGRFNESHVLHLTFSRLL
jgi:hypothetical protein